MTAGPFTIALAGNPNVGKSTLFNALTGSRQHVGNWPGKTVEKKEGRTTINGRDIVVVDLPGTYSLAAHSVEEIIARDFIICERPQVIIVVVDAANLERNLYLACQILELETPAVLALNMSDEAHKRGVHLDPQALSAALGGIPVVETVGSRGIGLDALKAAIQTALAGSSQPFHLAYDALIEAGIARLAARIGAYPELTAVYPARWLALKLLEADTGIVAQLEREYPALIGAARTIAQNIAETLGDELEILIADQRYQFIGSVISASVTRTGRAQITPSERIDTILTHRIWGIPLFLALMWVVFQFTANVSAPFVDWIDGVISGPITRWASTLLTALGLGGSWVQSLVTDGIIAGVGGVLVFIPVLTFLYLAIALLEDSGYMARAAFIMDRVMRILGLHGKSFLPLLIGFGCTVPAIYATRTLEHEQDRKLTGFLATFMSCGARLPVYVVFASLFFGARAGNLIFALYLLGIVVAFVTGWIMKHLIYRGQPPHPFVMELPPYRLPTLSSVLRTIRGRIQEFVQRAFTIILACSVIIWLLMALPATLDWRDFNQVSISDSWFGAISGVAAPAFAPAGFGQPEAAGVLLSGFIAKEVIIGTISQIYGGETADEADSSTPSTLADDLREIVYTFGQAAVLTAQEAINILPRTANLLPGVDLPEANFLPLEAETDAASGQMNQALTQAFTPLSAVAFTVFVLLYVPCLTALTAMRLEFGVRWMLYQVVYTAAVAWVGAVAVYQGGLLLGLGGG